jgi:6-phosphofructokinase 2
MAVIATLTVNPTIDVGTSVDYVVAERKLRCGPPSYEPGGGGLNVSRAIRKLGGESIAMYVKGGSTGELLQDLLEAEGVGTRAIPIENWIRQNMIVSEESTERQYRFGLPGPELREKEWRACLDALSSLDPKPDYIVASGSLPPGPPVDFYAHVARLGREMGSRVIVDTSGEALKKAVEEGVYLLKPNLKELGDITGQKFQSELQQEKLAMKLIESGRSEVLVVSLGSGGALLATVDGYERLHPPTVPIRSKVGAGDSMVAGITLALARGKTVAEAAVFGVASGTAAVMTSGTELCRREDAERLFEEMMRSRSRTHGRRPQGS